jgi:putative glycosyltransferase (TIGR04372 family)
MFKVGFVRESIGHSLVNPWLYFHNSKNRLCVLLIVNKKKITNYEAFELLVEFLRRRHYIILWDTNLEYIFRRICNSKFKRFLKPFIADTYSIHHRSDYIKYGNHISLHSENPGFPELEMLNSKSDIVELESLKELLGIGSNYICLYCRDGSFYGDLDNPRNASCETVFSALDSLAVLGFSIVLMQGMKSTRVNNNFIDYGASKYASNRNDLLLVRHSKFCFSNNSGFVMLPWLFNKKILLHNWFPAGLRPHTSENSIYILKYYKKNDSFIPFYEIEEDLLLSENTQLLRLRGYEIIENTQEDLKALLLDYFYGDDGHEASEVFGFQVYGGKSRISSRWKKVKGHLLDE